MRQLAILKCFCWYITLKLQKDKKKKKSIHSTTNVITCARLRLKANVATDEGKDRNEM